MEQSTKLNGWDLEEFQQTVEAVKEEPEAGKLTWRSRAEWDAGFGLEVRTEEIEMMRSLPVWPARVALAPTIPREMSAWESYVSNFDPARLRGSANRLATFHTWQLSE